jgi:hypothetical protein
VPVPPVICRRSGVLELLSTLVLVMIQLTSIQVTVLVGPQISTPVPAFPERPLVYHGIVSRILPSVLLLLTSTNGIRS